jgi:hypothetical protein
LAAVTISYRAKGGFGIGICMSEKEALSKIGKVAYILFAATWIMVIIIIHQTDVIQGLVFSGVTIIGFIVIGYLLLKEKGHAKSVDSGSSYICETQLLKLTSAYSCLVRFLNYEDANKLVIEITGACEKLALDRFLVTGKREVVADANSYSVHVAPFIGLVFKQEIKGIVEKLGLIISEEETGIAIH